MEPLETHASQHLSCWNLAQRPQVATSKPSFQCPRIIHDSTNVF